MRTAFRFFKFTYSFVISIQPIHLHKIFDGTCFFQTAGPSLYYNDSCVLAWLGITRKITENANSMPT